jgi:hypothetical protein
MDEAIESFIDAKPVSGCFENEDLRKRRPKMGLRNYENEDPLRKRRPIFVFVLRKLYTLYFILLRFILGRIHAPKFFLI